MLIDSGVVHEFVSRQDLADARVVDQIRGAETDNVVVGQVAFVDKEITSSQDFRLDLFEARSEVEMIDSVAGDFVASFVRPLDLQ